MKENIWSNNPVTEVIKWAVFSIMLTVGVVINYTYVEQLPLFVRAAASALMIISAIIVGFKTSLGHQLKAFIQSSRTELRKVVWPTRQETVQVSIIVVIMVMVMSLILWGFDMALFKLMAWFTGQGV